MDPDFVKPVRTLTYGKARVRIYASRQALGRAAAAEAVEIIQKPVHQKGGARILVATGNSQLEMIHTLAETPGIPWSSVSVFHLDEYVGIPAPHPSSFRFWVKNRIENKVHPYVVQYIEGILQVLQRDLHAAKQRLDAATEKFVAAIHKTSSGSRPPHGLERLLQSIE
jgi:6-phosphogluconolactonase/glucosamine-6-phosphate isomerase/deaminase